MSEMFDGCFSLTDLDITHFDMSNVSNKYNMFGG
jgi:surface protein